MATPRPAPVPMAIPPFKLGSVSIVAHPRGASGRESLGGLQLLAQEAKDVVLEHWRMDPRPTVVRLPSGDVIEGFDKFEIGQAAVKADSRSPQSSRLVEPRFD